MILFPNAKINIGLDILRRRPDGYHELETVMAPTGWTDILEIVPGKHDDATLTVTGHAITCPTEKNLVMKAYRLLASLDATIPPVDMYLHKMIPDGAGLGGGSADAAFALKGINEVLSLGLSTDRLETLAARLGADCPFFIRNSTMLCYGTGTDMRPAPIDVSCFNIVIVKPNESVSTAEAYAGIKPSIPAMPLSERLQLPPEQWKDTIINDFEPSIEKKLPSIGTIKRRLYESGAIYASMSGSGSAVYGLFKGDILSDDITDKFPGCVTFAGSM